MICSKIIRTVVKDECFEPEEEIVTGISDYIPHCLKTKQDINISLIGNTQQIINQIIWNQFYSKSLLKQCYYLLMHNYSTEGKQPTTAVFIKNDKKIFNIQQILDWREVFRVELLRQKDDVISLELEAFTNKGNSKRINIFISNYPINIEKIDLILKTNSIQPAKIFKNTNVEPQCRTLQQTNKQSKAIQSSQSSKTFNTHKPKYSQVSNLTENRQSKQNSNSITKKQTKKTAKNSRKDMIQQKTSESNKKPIKKTIQITKVVEAESLKDNYNIQISQNQRPSINRQSVLSRIITSKQEQIIFLKEQLQQIAEEYEATIKEQQQAHEKQVSELSLKVKEVLSSYENSQRQVANQNVYLKERTIILEQNLSNTNNRLEKYTSEMQVTMKQMRGLQETNKRLSQSNRQLSQQQQKNRSSYIGEFNRMNAEVLSWKQKAQDYKVKYQKIVDMMKNVINFT